VLLTIGAIWLPLRVLIALVVFFAFYLFAAKIVRAFLKPIPDDPDPEKVRVVSERFRCSICGAEVTMTAAPEGFDPEAPRHCREDMLLVVEAE